MIKLREKFGNSQNIGKFQFSSATAPEILKLLKNIDDKRAAGTDKIPPKLVKLSLSQKLAHAINNNISKGVFPDNAKVASVSRDEKKLNDKNKVFGLKPISVFSKIYESVKKNQLTSILNNLFLPYFASYRESYNTKHVLIRLLEDGEKILIKITLVES